MRLSHTVKGEILALIDKYQGYIDVMVEETSPRDIDQYWWDKREIYACKIDVLEELLDRLQ